MTCKKSRRLIALYRSGERTEAEVRALEEHLRSCPACAKENEQTVRSLAPMRAISSQEPVLRDPDEFSREILAHISGLPSRRRHWMTETMFLPAQRREVRIALLAMVLVAVGAFGIQSYQTLMDMQRIEQQYSLSQREAMRVQVNYEIDLSQVPMTREQESTLHKAGIFVDQDSDVVITARMLKTAWSIIERPLFSEATTGLQKMGLDWNSLVQRFKASSNAKLALTESE